jgi:hypothetical protein
MSRLNGPVEPEFVTIAKSRSSLALSDTIPSHSSRQPRVISSPAVPALKEMLSLTYNFQQCLLVMALDKVTITNPIA